MAMISVGCKLMSGILMEMGVSIIDGNVTRGPDYKCVKLNGANQHHQVMGAGLQTPAPKELTPGITNNVDEAFFDAWVAAHKDTNIVRNKLVYKAKSVAEAHARAQDDAQRPIGMEPLDPTKVRGIAPLDRDAA